MPKKVYIDLYGNQNNSTIDITWRLSRKKFGKLLIICDRKNNEFRVDTEGLDKETITKIIKLAAPQIAETLIYLDISVEKL